MANYSNKISNEEIQLLLYSWISHILYSHRTTNFFQKEIEPYDAFSQQLIIAQLASSVEEKEYLKEQFEYLEENPATWNEKYFKNSLGVDFISKHEILNNKLTHFRFSIPVLTLKKDLLVLKVVYQNSFQEQRVKGSNCIELFKHSPSGEWKNTGHLFGTSL